MIQYFAMVAGAAAISPPTQSSSQFFSQDNDEKFANETIHPIRLSLSFCLPNVSRSESKTPENIYFVRINDSLCPIYVFDLPEAFRLLCSIIKMLI